MENNSNKKNINKQSKVTQYIFLALLIFYISLFEILVEDSVRTNSLLVVWDWLGNGEAWGILLFFWILTALCWIAFTGDHLHNIYVALTGKLSTYVFLGDKLNEGQYVYKEDDKNRSVIFVPWFILKNEYPNSTFHKIYSRKYMYKDSEGNLTDAINFKTGKTIIFTVVQMVCLLFSGACALQVIKYYAEAHHRTATSSGVVEGILVVFHLLVYVAGNAIIISKQKDIKQEEAKVLPLPVAIKEGAVLDGKVIAIDIYQPTGQEKGVKRSYKQFTIEFDGRSQLSPPAYLTWVGERIIGHVNSSKSYREERDEKKKYYDEVFERLEAAQATGSYIQFRVDEGLTVVPKMDDLGKPPLDYN